MQYDLEVVKKKNTKKTSKQKFHNTDLWTLSAQEMSSMRPQGQMEITWDFRKIVFLNILAYIA